MSTNTHSGSRLSLWITIVQAALLGVVAGLGGYVLISIVLNPTVREQGHRPRVFQGERPSPSTSGRAALDVVTDVVKL